MTRLLRTPVSWVVAANVALFVWLTGGRILWPGHVSWLMWGDSAQHYLGWEFFRRGPLTVWPPGASPLFGVGYSSSVVYADAIPLLALPMKFLLAFTDAQFQYLGAWLLACFVLQGVFAVMLLRRFGVDGPVLVPGALLFSIAPVFLYRMVTGSHGHMALVGHFFVLWALWLVLDLRLSHRRWLVVLLVSLLVQFYLFVIVGYFYMVAIGWWVWRQRSERPWSTVSRSVVVNVSTVVVVAYLAGYFMGGSSVADGFGQFRTDIVGFVDPSPNDFPGWSAVLPNPYNVDGTHEGYAFLGSATLILVVAAIVGGLLRRSRIDTRLTVLAAASAPLFLLALTNRLQFAGREVGALPLPAGVETLLNVVRATGRFSWPIVYVFMCSAIVMLIRVVPHRVTITAVVSVALVIQLVDSRTALAEVNERFVESSREETYLRDARWATIAEGATCLVVSPPQVKGPYWRDFAEYAVLNGMSTNVSYLSRWDQSVVEALAERTAERIDSLDLDDGCLYVMIIDRGQSSVAEADYLRTTAGQDKEHDYVIDVVDDFVVLKKLADSSS
ncbi:MAG: DUF6311 domain-containing protein [Ilumatobacteraceae bacterium]